MRKRVAIYGATTEALQLLPLLEANPDIEIAAVFDADTARARDRLAALGGDAGSGLRGRLGDDLAIFDAAPGLDAVIDSGIEPALTETLPQLVTRGVQIVTPLTARLLWGYGVAARDRKTELLQALHEIVESVNLTVDPDELFGRMLEIAMGVTGADGGSLMLLDDDAEVLTVRVAVGVERELWPKIRVRVGDGIAGRAVADARPLKLRGKADRQAFRIVRERFDVESALCVPLIHGDRVLGVLNMHHSTRADAFDDDDLDFAEQLGRLDAEIIARAQEHENLRSQAGRYAAVQEVQRVLTGRAPLLDRLGELCRGLAEHLGHGIATVYLTENDDDLRLAATSLDGGGFGAEYRIVRGQGVEGSAAVSGEPAFLHGANGALAYAALPLATGDGLLGVLSVQAGADTSGLHLERGFEETLIEIARAAAEEIAQASREARMTSHATKVGAINEAGIRLVSARDISEVIGLATSSGALILEADHAVLRLQDPDTRRYVIRSYYGGADGRQQEGLFRLDKQISVDVIKRRKPFFVREVARDASYAHLAQGGGSVLAAPLLHDDRIVGTLALYDKMAPDPFQTGIFDNDDFEIFTKYAHYVERAIAHAQVFSQARQQRSHDADTGLPTAEYLERRIDEEIARAGDRPGTLALATCRLENLDEIRRGTDPVHADRVVQRTAQALASQVRAYDVVARTAEGEFSALLPEPGASPDERVARLARAVADEIAKDEALNQRVRVSLVFGYAVHPSDGADRKALLGRARAARIHMV